MNRFHRNGYWCSWLFAVAVGWQLPTGSPAWSQTESGVPLPQAPVAAEGVWIPAAAPAPVFQQATQFVAPAGAKIAFWDGTSFVEAGESTATVRLQVGSVYLLRISEIPQAEGVEIFPTIEVLNHLNPPPAQPAEIPVVVEIPWDDLRQAIDGKLVTRVVYLEDPATAMPSAQAATEQQYFDVAPHQDPLQVARDLGRPMARIRLGNRVPDLALESR